MTEVQDITHIDRKELVDRIKAFHDDGFRLVQIGCTTLDEGFQLDYSFDKAYRFSNLRLTLPLEGASVPSISDFFWCAFTYENEIHDLFGIEITDINVDYKGKFYRTSKKTPFRPSKTTQAEKEEE